MGNLHAIHRESAAHQAEPAECVGRVYRIGLATVGRQPHFARWKCAADACRIITAPVQWQRSRLLAWVLMPDHWQGLVAVGGFDDVGSCIARLKRRSERLLGAAHPQLGPLWASDFHTVCADDGLTAARQLVMHPVRTGLVQRIGDYPFWDAQWLRDGLA